MAKRYDAIIIGAGQSGPPRAGRMNQEGLRVAIIERKLMGGAHPPNRCRTDTHGTAGNATARVVVAGQQLPQ